MSVSFGFSYAGVKSFFAIKPRRQLREMYFFLLLFSLAAALITVFEPIFFYMQGISLWQICLYYALHYVLYVILMPLGGVFSARFGYERSLALATPFFVIYFLLLAGLSLHPYLLWLALIVLTVFKVFYWPAYHANFASYSDPQNRGTEQSWVGLFEYGAGVVGPILGGVVAHRYGFPVLFLVTALMVAMAGFALLWTPERRHFSTFTYASAWRVITSRRNRSMVIGMIGWGENLVYLAIWPVFLLLMVGDVKTVGIVAGASALLATMLGFLVGEATDRITGRRMLQFLVPYVMMGYAWRMFAVLPWHALVGDLFARTGTVGITISVMSRLYRQAKRVGTIEYVVAFETVLAMAKAVTALVLLIAFLVLPTQVAFVVAFAVAATLSLFYRVL